MEFIGRLQIAGMQNFVKFQFGALFANKMKVASVIEMLIETLFDSIPGIISKTFRCLS